MFASAILADRTPDCDRDHSDSGGDAAAGIEQGAGEIDGNRLFFEFASDGAGFSDVYGHL